MSLFRVKYLSFFLGLISIFSFFNIIYSYYFNLYLNLNTYYFSLIISSILALVFYNIQSDERNHQFMKKFLLFFWLFFITINLINTILL